MKRRNFLVITASAAIGAMLPLSLPSRVETCLSCGAPTDVHLIDCTRPLGSAERARTVCFSCTPEARVIDKYWYGFPSVMHARKHNAKCSECGTGMGYIHLRDRDFEYRLCGDCAPEARDCRRWVRDLCGNL